MTSHSKKEAVITDKRMKKKVERNKYGSKKIKMEKRSIEGGREERLESKKDERGKRKV
jgi:hypothetical protein